MMHRVPSFRSVALRRAATALTLVLLLTALVAAAAGPAAAASAPRATPSPGPTETTMSLSDLRATIAADPDNSVPGYFNTVLRGSSIVRVPCNILAVVDGLLWDNSALIMFEVTDPGVLKLGGVAGGMSGSPLFVDEGGAPADNELVGAVSYGNYFTTNGLGLATPIEFMAEVEGRVAVPSGLLAEAPARLVKQPAARALAQPVEIRQGTTIKRIVMAPTMKQAKAVDAGSGTAVMAPLITVGIGGIDPQSAAFKHLAARFEQRGLNVLATGHSGVYDTFETDLVGGAAVGAVMGYGDYWIGAMGTVTYSHDGVVVAFGHPFYGDGETSLILTNAYVHGVWSSLERSTKIMTLGKIRGQITQDRAHGIAGFVGAPPAMADITSTATLQPAGATATAETLAPRDMPDAEWILGDIVWGTTVMPVDELLDGNPSHVSADTGLEVVVNDGTADLTVTRANMLDDLWMVGEDGYSIVSALLSNPNDTAPASLISVDATTDLALVSRSATILDVEVPGGLKIGDNIVTTTLRRYGETDVEQLQSTLTIPEDTYLQGNLEVSGGSSWGGWYWSDSSSNSMQAATRASGTTTRYTIEPPPTLNDIIEDIESWPQNNDLTVTFVPERSEGPDSSSSSGDAASIDTTSRTGEVVYGWASKRTTDGTVRAQPRRVDPRHRAVLHGFFYEVRRGEAGTVNIYKVGATNTLLTTVPLPAALENGFVTFTYRTPRLKKTTRFLAVWSGNEEYLGATATCRVRVR
jgi:hypothetical protein